MASKRFKLGVLISIIAIVLCVGFALVMGQPIFGLDFSDGYIVRIDLKKDFDTNDVMALIQPLRKDLQDAKVTATGSGEVAQALVYVQKMDDALQAELMSAVQGKYEDAKLRGVSEIKTEKSKMALLPYALFLGLAAIATAIYFGLRKNVSAGIGFILSAFLTVLVTLAVCIACAIPLNVITVVGGAGVALAGLALYVTLFSQSLDAEDEATKLGAKQKNIATITLIFLLAVCAAIFVLGGVALRSFAAILCIGLISGLLSAAFVALPFSVQYYEKFKAKPKTKKRKKI